MNEREFGGKIKQDLNYATGRLTGKVTERLKLAREQALEVFSAQAIGVDAYAFAGHSSPTQPHPVSSRIWLPLSLITLAFLGALYWQQEVNHEENLDVALLTSDLPLNVFVDQNFQTWLDRSSQH